MLRELLVILTLISLGIVAISGFVIAIEIIKDEEPPTIDHTPITNAIEDNPITIEAIIYDKSQVQEAMLYYRKTEDISFQSIKMKETFIGNSTGYVGTIPADYVTIEGVEYYIEATDGANNATDPPTNPTTSPHIITVTSDSDNDGVPDSEDPFPEDPTPTIDKVENVEGHEVKAQVIGSGTIQIVQVEEPPSDPPSEYEAMEVFVDITIEGTIDDAYITISYKDEDIPEGISESSLRLFHWNEETDSWEEIKNSGVDTETNTVWAYTDHLSVFAPMGKVKSDDDDSIPGFDGVLILGVVLLMIAIASIRRRKLIKIS